MTTVIACQSPGRPIPAYELLYEMTERYGISRREAHDRIHSFLADLGYSAIVGLTLRRPAWADAGMEDTLIEITDEAAEQIRAAFNAAYA